MKQLHMFLICLLSGLIVLSSCNKPSEVGLDVFDGQQANVISQDSFSIKAKTVRTGEVKIRNSGQNNLTGLLCGNYEDPVFGNVRSDVFIKFMPSQIIQDSFLFNREPEDVIIDSVVMSLAYKIDNSASNPIDFTYGDTNEDYTLEVYKVTELLDDEMETFSDNSFDIEATPWLTHQFKPDFDTIVVNNIINASVVTDSLALPQLRLRLDNSFAEDLLFFLDSPILDTSSDTFDVNQQELDHLANIENELLKGFCFKIAETNSSIINFNPLSSYTSINIYFKTKEIFVDPPVDTTVLRQLRLLPNRFYHTNFTHDYSGAVVESFIDSEDLGDSLLFMQSMKGLDIELEFPYLDKLENVIINKATLEFNAIELPGDNLTDYNPVILVQAVETINGEDFLIEDLAIANSQSNGNIYGGRPAEETVNEERIYKYSMNLSGHMQRIIDGEVDARLKLTPVIRAEFANRLVFAGNNHPDPDLKPRLILTYTDLNN